MDTVEAMMKECLAVVAPIGEGWGVHVHGRLPEKVHNILPLPTAQITPVCL